MRQFHIFIHKEMSRMKHLVLLLVILAATSCGTHKNKLRVDVSDINVPDIKMHRYDQDLFRVRLTNLSQDLKSIRNEYPFFLGTNLDDPGNLASMKDYLEDPRNTEFQKDVALKFKDLSSLEKELTDGFRHIRYYFPQIRIPRVYTYISGGDYDNPIRLADSVLLIALDCYLGKDYKPYLTDGVPLYKAARMIPEQIVPDCMRTMAAEVFRQDPANLTLLEQMTEAGKSLYLLQAFIPDLPGDLLMKYSADQYEWAVKNESHVWAAIIDNRMLYSTEGKSLRMFMADGPYTPEFSKESPSRLGEWIGFQIVRSYMNENDVSLKKLLEQKDAQQLLQLSGYKPERE